MYNDTVLTADDRRYRAMIDVNLAELDRVLSDDLVYMHSSGSVDSKASLIEGLERRKFTFLSAETSGTTVRLYGDIAVLHGKVKLQVQAGGREHRVQSGFTTVWNLEGAEWRLVHWQSTPLPATD
ncbi:hypothetical protein CSC62_08675 [Pseudoxanthomonas jiangsuensis]|uniref:nuclear transport factor 2 family protein n=1 Tax=Pseudoxanthomonas jiangsuensis TaxID=619688 RepID=UPI001390CD8D|nr:nuclear transport factor 2 family protein [Pseudoxanthomonas jiangsuensis]KAF1697266.1 hypothetical protein CSC62_08675 [Pseudoxanthomonas jiangsuensis]